MTIVGTRPELIKLSRVIPALDEASAHILVHTGQNFDYELNEVFFQDLGIRRPDLLLEAARGSAAETIANVIVRADEAFVRHRPDALLLYGDTNSCLAVIPAKRRHIPVFHLEAGNRSFDDRVPEEINRRLVDHLSDVNMPLTEHARRYLVAEGIRPETIFKVGSPMKEVLEHNRAGIDRSTALERLGLTSRRYMVASLHREENVDDEAAFVDLIATLNAVAAAYRMPVIVSTHPRTRQWLEQRAPSALNPLVRFEKPFAFTDYVKLQTHAYCVLSDSGTIVEESALLTLPAVMIREAHERPEGVDAGTIIMSGLKASSVLHAMQVVIAQHERTRRYAALPPDYDVTDVSTKVVRIILSYIGYVNRTVWFRRE